MKIKKKKNYLKINIKISIRSICDYNIFFNIIIVYIYIYDIQLL